jgi:hypothetical protein
MAKTATDVLIENIIYGGYVAGSAANQGKDADTRWR